MLLIEKALRQVEDEVDCQRKENANVLKPFRNGQAMLLIEEAVRVASGNEKKLGLETI